MSKVEKYVQEAISIANNNSHGYSQASRWGTPDYDCSSLVISVVQNAGIPVKDYGSTFTGNMYGAFRACGFDDVTNQVSLYNGGGMQRGDILLNDANHTAIYIGNGQLVHARGSDGHPEPGDQTGNEIRTQGYWNYPWDRVLRYHGEEEAEPPTPEPRLDITARALKFGDIGADVAALQAGLNYLHFPCGSVDGEFGKNTQRGVNNAKTAHGKYADGIADSSVWKLILGK